MDRIFPPSSSLRVAIVADVDVHAVNKFAERFIPNDPSFDLVLLLGPLTHRECETGEDLAAAKADIAAIIAQLETVVCRVVYLASDRDPTEVLTEQLHLTPNSVNIHARSLPLARGLYACGFAETRGNLQCQDAQDVTHAEEEPVEGLQVSSSVSSVQIIAELLGQAARQEVAAAAAAGAGQEVGEMAGQAPGSLAVPPEGVFIDAMQGPSAPPLGLFCLNYKFSFTLNHFLFHTPEALAKAGVGVAVIAPPFGEMQAQTRPKLPKAFNGMTIVDCGSLRDSGSFVVLSVARGGGGASSNNRSVGVGEEEEEEDKWAVVDVEYCSMKM